LTNPDAIEDAFSQNAYDAVINAAAYTAVDRAEEERDAAYAVNRDAPAVLASLCAAKDIPFLHISTDFVFNGQKELAYLETDACHPLGVYGQSKWEGELKVAKACEKYLILRTAWVFGGEQNFVNTMKRLAETRDELSVVDDQRGCPTAAQDIARCLLEMVKTAVKADFQEWGIYHYAGMPSVSWYEFATEILNSDPTTTVNPILTSGYPTPAARPANSVLDCDKIKSVFGIAQPDWRKRL
ncbi:MAG: dTDP-4-dehydrorhamnose reductase, partial [Sneathiella sp.]